MIDDVMFEIREMTGQDYRNHYAGEKIETSTDVPVVPAGVTEDTPSERHQEALVGAR
jgi:hypothetical protein